MFIEKIKENTSISISILWIILLCFMMIGYSSKERISNKEIYNLESKIIDNKNRYTSSLKYKDSIILHKEKNIDSLQNYLNSKEYLEFLIYKKANLDNFKLNLNRVDYEILDLMVSQANKYNIPYTIYFRLIDMESGFKFVINVSSGALGYMQLMPNTFKSYYKKLGLKGGHTKKNNIIIGSYKLNKNYKKWRKKGKSDYMAWRYTLAEYNTGLGNMQLKENGKVIGYYIPTYTHKYINYIMRYY